MSSHADVAFVLGLEGLGVRCCKVTEKVMSLLGGPQGPRNYIVPELVIWEPPWAPSIYCIVTWALSDLQSMRLFGRD